ncbi:MAG TPA: hypothetical protein VGR40_07740, partial [Candidatus Binatus sp.]|nr:hypothetical protein [Candidatus Binatus sp.]
MAIASSTASSQLDRRHPPDLTGDVLTRADVAAGSVRGKPKDSDFPRSRGVTSSQLKLGLKDSI